MNAAEIGILARLVEADCKGLALAKQTRSKSAIGKLCPGRRPCLTSGNGLATGNIVIDVVTVDPVYGRAGSHRDSGGIEAEALDGDANNMALCRGGIVHCVNLERKNSDGEDHSPAYTMFHNSYLDNMVLLK